MSQIVNIYFERMLLDNEGFPYEGNQDVIQIINNDQIVLEFDNGVCTLYTLSNKKIEYSIEFSSFSRSNSIIILNEEYEKKGEDFFSEFLNVNIQEINFLHQIEGKEYVMDQFAKGKDLSNNLIGVKFLFDNDKEMFIYSSEPAMINDQIRILRESSVLCLLLDTKNDSLLTPLDRKDFPSEYELLI